MANNNIKFPSMAFSFLPAANGNALDTTSEDSEDEFYTKRIMLIAESREITVQAIKNLCDRFGELVKPIHVPANNKHWFFAEFRTASEAEQAIRYINQNGHLKIKAVFSKKKRRGGAGENRSSQPMQQKNADITINMQNRRVQGPFSKNIGVNRFENIDDCTKMEAQMNILSNGGAYSRPGDERFKVLNGRSTFQESDANLAMIKAMAEKSQGTYDLTTNSYGHNVTVATNVVVGPCTKCGRVSERQCEVCMDPYCSPECQRLDWPAHKKICRPMPALVPAVFGPDIVQMSKPVEKVVPFLPLPTPQSQLFGVLPPRKPAPVITPKPAPITAEAAAASQVTGMPLQAEIELIKQKIRSTMVTDQPKHAPFPRSGENVVITAAPSSGVLYLRAIDNASDISFRQVIQDVTRYAATAKLLDVKPKRGDYVLALFEGVYYRANVLSPNNNCTDETIKLAYIDFGNMAVVKWRECKAIVNSEIIGLTRHNFKVYLQNVDYTKHTNDATSKLISKCVDENVPFELRYEGTLPIKEKREVVLVRVSDNMSLNAKIKELATIVPPKLDDLAVFGCSDLTMKAIPSGKNMHLLVLDASLLKMGEVTCILKRDIPCWQAMLGKVTNYCKTLSPNDNYMPRENELCLAQFEDDAMEKSWYRGMCVESVGDQHPTICFIDFGNITPVSVSDIRKIPKELVQLPLYATSCRIKGLPDDVTVVLPLLEEMFEAGREIYVDAVDVEEKRVDGTKHISAILTINSLNL